MSSFTKPLEVKILDDGANYELLSEFSYYRENDKDDILVVPSGFVTDQASVPRIFWSIIPPFGRYGKAAVLHDYLYDKTCTYNYSRKDCDKIFYEAMRACKTKKITAKILYYGVRLGGRSRFRK